MCSACAPFFSSFYFCTISHSHLGIMIRMFILKLHPFHQSVYNVWCIALMLHVHSIISSVCVCLHSCHRLGFNFSLFIRWFVSTLESTFVAISFWRSNQAFNFFSGIDSNIKYSHIALLNSTLNWKCALNCLTVGNANFIREKSEEISRYWQFFHEIYQWNWKVNFETWKGVSSWRSRISLTFTL